jgi:hypothetical protein
MENTIKPKHDLSATRKAIEEAVNLEEVVTQLKVNLEMKPNKRLGFIQTLYSKQIEMLCIEGRDAAGEVRLYPAHFDDPELYKDYPEKKLVQYVPIITTFQQFGFWPLKQPINGRVMAWHTTGKAAAQTAEGRWTQIYADNTAKAYVLVHPKDPNVFDGIEPEWPEKFLKDPEAYLVQALQNEDQIITQADDERLLRMVGAIR